MPDRVLITGGTSFLGAYLTEDILASTDWDIYSIERLPSHPDPRGVFAFSGRVKRRYHDYLSPLSDQMMRELEGVRYVFHLGAEVGSARSVNDPRYSITSSVMGTANMLEIARYLNPELFVYVSSADVLGPCPWPVSLPENAPLRPTSPYASGKAAGEALVNAYSNSYGIRCAIVRSANMFGVRQGTDRFVPMVVRGILNGQRITCHVGVDGRAVSRHWLWARHFSESLLGIVRGGYTGVYHSVGPEKSTIEIVASVAASLGRGMMISEKVVDNSHESRYSLVDTKLRASFDQDFEQRLSETVLWYAENREWLDA